jgi:glycosyltransferase involved in cell wall biosynthesis
VNRRPLVLLDASAARPPCTGVAWSMIELVTALAAEERELRFAVATFHPALFAGLASAPARTQWEVIPLPPGRLPAVGWRLGSLARRLGAGVLHSLTIPPPLRVPCPLAVTVHDLAFRTLPGSVPAARRLWYAATLPGGLRRADAVLVNSAATGREVAAAFPFTAGKILPTPFGTPAWTEGRAAPRERPATAPFLFVGALEPRKNLENVLAALDLLREETAAGSPAPRLRVIGAPGWCNRALLDRLRRAVAAGNVELVGYCDRDSLWSELVSARALLFPSLHEGFGFPILEAMAARLPVITSDRGAMREVAGDAALLVDPESPREIAGAMRRISSEPGLADRLVRAGEARRSVWSWRSTAERTLAAYLRLLDVRTDGAN